MMLQKADDFYIPHSQKLPGPWTLATYLGVDFHLLKEYFPTAEEAAVVRGPETWKQKPYLATRAHTRYDSNQ